MSARKIQKQVCVQCFQPFEAEPHPRFGSVPTKCPKCRRTDPYRQFISRKCVGEWIVQNDVDWKALMKQIEKPLRENADRPWKYDFKGREHGAIWSGRIVVWAEEPPAKGEIILIRQMQSTYQIRVAYEEYGSIGALFKFREVVNVKKPIFLPLDSEEGELAEETHEYFVLEKVNQELQPQYRLVLYTIGEKTTLKGYGRQEFMEFEHDPQSIDLAIAYGQFRTGRAWRRTVLSLLPLNDQIVIKRFGHTGSGKVFSEQLSF